MMKLVTDSLSDIIDAVETKRKRLQLCNATEADLAAIESFFANHDLEIETVEAEHRPDGVVDLYDHGERIASSPLATVRRYVRAWEESMAVGLRTEQPAVVTGLRDNYFESYDKQRMVMASRIGEFRAWNHGTGELHVGFQQLSKLDYQPNAYRNLAATDVDVHVYGEPDREPLPELDLTVHGDDSAEVLDHWWVAYDGDGDDDEKVVLLAQERAPNKFYGFWTERPHVVDDVLDRLAHLE